MQGGQAFSSPPNPSTIDRNYSSIIGGSGSPSGCQHARRAAGSPSDARRRI